MLKPLFSGIMSSKTQSAHLYEPQLEAIDQLIEEHGIGRSEAIRRLITEGVESRQRREKQTPAELLSQLGWAGLAGSVGAIAAGAPTVAGAVAAVAALLFVVSAGVRWRRGGVA